MKYSEAKQDRIFVIRLEDGDEIAGTGTIFPDEENNPILHMHIACGRKGGPKMSDPQMFRVRDKCPLSTQHPETSRTQESIKTIQMGYFFYQGGPSRGYCERQGDHKGKNSRISGCV